MKTPKKHRLTDEQVKTLYDLKKIARDTQSELLLIGATARLLQLDWPLDLPAGRTTNDVDFVVRQHSWEEHFAFVRTAFSGESSDFTMANNHPHKLTHHQTGTPVDLVPFGNLENPPGTLTWPNSGRVMTMDGMGEADETAVLFEITPDLVVRVVNLAAFVVLKLFSWHDRGDLSSVDLRDADIVLRKCVELPEYSHRYWSLAETIENSAKEFINEFDYTEHGGTAVIAQDLRSILRPETRLALAPIIAPLQETYSPAVERLLKRDWEYSDEEQARRIINIRYKLLSRCLEY